MIESAPAGSTNEVIQPSVPEPRESSYSADEQYQPSQSHTEESSSKEEEAYVPPVDTEQDKGKQPVYEPAWDASK